MSSGDVKHLQAHQTVCVLTVPGQRVLILNVRDTAQAAPVVLVAFGPFSPERRRDVAGGFIFGRQELVKGCSGFGRDGNRPAVTGIVAVVCHPGGGVCVGVAATTWS